MDDNLYALIYAKLCLQGYEQLSHVPNGFSHQKCKKVRIILITTMMCSGYQRWGKSCMRFKNFFIDWLIDLWLCWVFVSVRGLSLVAASGGHSSSRCAGLSLSRPLLLRSTGSRRAGSVIVAHGPICSAACGILPDQGSNTCPPHWQADSAWDFNVIDTDVKIIVFYR